MIISHRTYNFLAQPTTNTIQWRQIDKQIPHNHDHITKAPTNQKIIPLPWSALGFTYS